jgi:hypothetical protein
MQPAAVMHLIDLLPILCYRGLTKQQYRIKRPPRALRRPGVGLDNVALVPSSLLPFNREWQEVANGLIAI